MASLLHDCVSVTSALLPDNLDWLVSIGSDTVTCELSADEVFCLMWYISCSVSSDTSVVALLWLLLVMKFARSNSFGSAFAVALLFLSSSIGFGT